MIQMESTLTKAEIINEGWIDVSDIRLYAIILKKQNYKLVVQGNPEKINRILITKECSEDAKKLLHGPIGAVIFNGKINSLHQFRQLMEIFEI